jgi:hypothetical protein
MFSDRDARWVACAQRLGLTLREMTKRSHVVDNVGYMMRALGPPAGPGLGVGQTWMVGHRGTTPVLVAQTRLSRQHCTDVVAAIEPPLLLGLRMRSERALLVSDQPDVEIGHAALDEKFDISAFDRQRASRVFAGADGAWTAAAHLLDASREARMVQATDNIVRIALPGLVTEPMRIESTLRSAVALAGALAASRATMPRVEGELPEREWATFAEAERMSFDAARMRVTGDFRGVPAEVRFCTADGSAYTAARAAVPVRLGVTLRVAGQSAADGASASFDDGASDVEIGDAAFDDAFCVQASNDAEARRLLGDAELRKMALVVVEHAGELLITDTHVGSAIRHPVKDAAHLAWVLLQLTGIARKLAGRDLGAGAPYR